MHDDKTYRTVLETFRDGKYDECATAAIRMLQSGATHDVCQLLLISLQRARLHEDIDGWSERILPALAQRPWYQTLVRVTLGQVDGPQALAEAADEADRVSQAHFYIGARHATLGQLDAARQSLDACLAIEGESIEKVLAGVERNRLPRQDDEVLSLNPGEQIRRLASRAFELFHSDKQQQARTLAERAYQLAMEQLDEADANYLSTIQSYGTILTQVGEPDKGLEIFQQQVRLVTRLHGDESEEAAIAYSNVALALNAMGRFAEAEPFVAKAAMTAHGALGPTSPTTAALVGNLALNQRRQGRYAEASTLYRTAYELRSAIESPEHPDSVTVLRQWAEMCDERGDAEAAARLRAQIDQLQARPGR